MSVEEVINRAKRSMKELEEEKRLKDLDEERLRRESGIWCPKCGSQRFEKYGHWVCLKCKCHTKIAPEMPE